MKTIRSWVFIDLVKYFYIHSFHLAGVIVVQVLSVEMALTSSCTVTVNTMEKVNKFRN